MADYNLWTDESYKIANLFQSMFVGGQFRRNFSEIRISKGQRIFENGDIDKLYYIQSGSIMMGINYEQQRLVHHIGYADTVFGEQIIDEQNLELFFAEALEESILFIMTKEELIKVCRRDRKALAFLMASLSKKFNATIHQLAKLVYHSKDHRIASFLFDFAMNRGQNTEQGLYVEHTFNQNTIAEFSGSSRQSVSSCINQLKKLNLIDFDRNSYLIYDPNAFSHHLKTI